MGSRFNNRANANYENETVVIDGFVSLDGSSNVIGYAPTNSPLNLAGPGNNLPYTRVQGLQKAIGQFGAVVNQPHTGAGIYQFTLDEPWYCMLEGWCQPIDQGAVQSLAYYVDANVTGFTGSTSYGYLPGQNQSLPAQTIKITFRTNAAGGALTNSQPNTGFWVAFLLKRTGV